MTRDLHEPVSFVTRVVYISYQTLAFEYWEAALSELGARFSLDTIDSSLGVHIEY
jgi:hypothetical protein